MFYLLIRVPCTLALVLASLVGMLWPASLHAEQVVRVAAFHNPPLVTYDERSSAVRGIYVDILEVTARRAGWKLVYVPGTYAEALVRLESGQIDLLPNAPHSRWRERRMSFTQEPVLSSWGQVYARPGTRIQSIRDLSQLRVAVLRSSLMHETLAQALGPQEAEKVIMQQPTFEAAYAAVASGQADAVVSNPFTGGLQARLHGLRATSVVLAPYTFRFATARGRHEDLLGQLDRSILELKADPNSIYFSRLQELMPDSSQFALPAWLKWAALAALALAALAAAWALTLRRAWARMAASERAQRRLAEELTRISDNSLDVIAVLDAHFNLVRISRATETLWGYAPSELEGRSCFDVLHPPARAKARQVLERVRGGRPERGSQARVLRKDGSEAIMLWSVVWSQQQRELYAIGRDDTERHELMSRLRRRTEEVQAANRDLRTFAQTVSHDLRAPVAAVTGFVAKVLRDEGDVLSNRSRDFLARAHVASERLDTIIANLLRLARVTEGGIHRCNCDVTAMSRDVIAALRNDDPGRDVAVEIQPGMRALADRALLRIVLDNLLANAWKFTSRMRHAHITVGCDDDATAPMFFVKDDGAGFDMEYAHHLFLPFRRLHGEAEFAGVGIGLATTHRVVTAHGGRIWAEGAPGTGAVFRFTLGRSSVSAKAAAGERPSVAAALTAQETDHPGTCGPTVAAAPRVAGPHPAASELAAPARKADEPAARNVAATAQAGRDDWTKF